MACADTQFCILLSYHPESETGKFFMIQKNSLLLNIVKDVCDCRFENGKLVDWNYYDTKETKNLGKKLLGKSLNFEDLKPLRNFIKNEGKSCPTLKFVDEIDFLKS